MMYNSKQACEISGATYRQLDYWQRTGLLEYEDGNSVGSGYQRKFSLTDVLSLRALAIMANPFNTAKAGTVDLSPFSKFVSSASIEGLTSVARVDLSERVFVFADLSLLSSESDLLSAVASMASRGSEACDVIDGATGSCRPVAERSS